MMTTNSKTRHVLGFATTLVTMLGLGSAHAANYSLPSGIGSGPFAGCSGAAPTYSCSGNVTFGGIDTINLTAPVTLNVAGDFDADKSLTITSNGHAFSINVGGNFTIKNNASINSATVVAGGNIELKNTPMLIGNFTAGGNITMANSATVTGNLTAGGNITTGTNAVITGNVVAGGQLSVGGGGVIVGSCAYATTNYVCVSAGPHHYELSLPTASVACLPTTVTVTACANDSNPCTSAYVAASGTTANLTTGGAKLGATTVTFNANGVATTTLSYPSAADGTAVSVTLSGEQTLATAARKCCPDGTNCSQANTCTTTFNTAGLIFSAAVGGGAATIPAQTAGVESGTYYVRAVKTNTSTKACEAALSGPSTVNFAYECTNPVACYSDNLLKVNGAAVARNDNGGVTSYTPLAMTFDPNGNAPFTFSYSDTGLIRLHARKEASGSLLAPLSGSSNAFVTKPFGFMLAAICNGTDNAASQTSPSASDPKFCRAGGAFGATVTAVASGGATTRNYGRETSAEGVAVAWSRHLPTGTGTSDGTMPSGGFTHNGGYTGSLAAVDLSWTEVGILKAAIAVGDGDYLGAGNVSSTAYVGRFYPDHFDTAVTPQCGGFAYSGRPGAGVVPGQSFGVTATARNVGGGTTVNYASGNGFAKAVDLSVSSGSTSGNLYMDSTSGGIGAVPAATFAAGVGTVLHSVSAGKLSFVFDSVPTAATAIQLHGEDADTTPSVGNDGSISIRSGRLWLGNAFGSDQIGLSMPYEFQYWNGNAFVKNTADTCSSFAAANIGLGNYLGGITATNMGIANFVVGANGGGGGSIAIAKPGGQVAGSVDLAVNLGATGADCRGLGGGTAAALGFLAGQWCGSSNDRNPNARATFGIFGSSLRKGPIYIRENY